MDGIEKVSDRGDDGYKEERREKKEGYGVKRGNEEGGKRGEGEREREEKRKGRGEGIEEKREGREGQRDTEG